MMKRYHSPDDPQAWTYASEPPVIEPAWASLASLEADVRARGGHWFDRDTLSFFGSRNRALIGGCVVIELQTKYPGAERYAVTPFGPDSTPVGVVCRHRTREAAKACARRIVAEGLIESEEE